MYFIASILLQQFHFIPVSVMPQDHNKPHLLIRPFVVLALPGMYLFYKYNQYKRKRKENTARRMAERELAYLNNKIVSMKIDIRFIILHEK